MLQRLRGFLVAALAACVSASCALVADDQVKGLDLAALRDNDAYVVGTITTVERFDDGTVVALVDSPKIRYSVTVCPSRPASRWRPRSCPASPTT